MNTPQCRCAPKCVAKLKLIGIASAVLLSTPAAASDPFGSIYGDENYVTIATGIKQRTTEAPAIVTIISQDRIRNSSARTLEELLEQVAGIHVSISQAGYNPIYQIRGISSDFNQQALTMINDVPVTHIYNGDQGVSWSHMPLSVIERIEIVRGPGSVLYGADAYAGVINIITKTNRTQQPLLQFGQGSFRTSTLHGVASTAYQDWNLNFAFEAGRTNGFEELVTSDLQSYFDGIQNTSASYAPAAVSAGKKWFDIWMQASQDDWILDFGFQGRYDVEEVIGWFGALDPTGQQNNSQWFLSAKNSQTFNRNSSLEHHLSIFHSTFDTTFYLLPPGNSAYPNGAISEIGFNEITARYNVAYNLEMNQHQLRFGLNTSIARLENIFERKNFQNNFSPTPGNIFITRTGQDDGIFIRPLTRKNLGLYAQDEYTWNEDSTLTLGLRFDHYNDFGSTWNPRAAWVYKITDVITSKVLYGTAFLAPSSFQLNAINNPVRLGNPELQPDKIRTLEGSLIFQINDAQSLNLNIFKNERKDIIELISGQYKNYGTQTGTGFELDYAHDISPLWTIGGNISIVRSEDSITHSQAAYVPQRQYFLHSLWRMSPSVSLNLEAFFIGDRLRTPNDSRPHVKDSSYMNISALYEPFNQNYSIKLSILNLTDNTRREPSSFSPADLPGLYFPEEDLPLPGRELFAELRWNF